MRALRDAGTMNPVILLDEVDKVGADWRGDPSAALLEVLDPAQNHSFRDHYLDVELDLSQVMFLATANVADTIPGPLLDRMEVIRFDGYTSEEKLAIAKGYLWPRQRDRNGLREDEVDDLRRVLRTIITEYTREAGVRNLERELGTVLRKTATQIASGSAEAPVEIDLDAVRDALGRQKFFQESAARTATPGVATGLAVTGAGGDVLFVEATAMKTRLGRRPGADRPARRRDEGVGADRALLRARPRRGARASTRTRSRTRSSTSTCPRARSPRTARAPGVTMVTALASLLSGRPVKHTVGMTGEVTLQGRVLPIGGLKQKVLAAHAAGLTDVILPERNRGDLDDIPEEVREQMSFHPVMTVRGGARPRAGARARCRAVVSVEPVPVEVRQAADLLERRWQLSIIYAALSGALRFNEFAEAVAGISPRMLSERLRDLEAAGLVERTVIPSSPPTVEYRLTPRGRALAPLMEALRQYAAAPL